jgi:hypothetical protein
MNDKNEQALTPTGITPADMILKAVTEKADLDKLEKLLALQERYEANEAKKAYYKAMAQFKANPPKIDKDKEVAFNTNAGKTSYKHATLGNVTEKVSAELSKYGLSAGWTTKQNGQICVTCRITHELGYSEETTLCAPADNSGSKNVIQQIGSTITYLERYTLLALTGLATYDQDDDGQAVGKQLINDNQKSQILDMINDLEWKPNGQNYHKFLKLVGTDSIDNIAADQFPKAILILTSAYTQKTKK